MAPPARFLHLTAEQDEVFWSERFEIAPLTLLPRLAWSDERAGAITPQAAAQTGLSVGTPVAVGAVDALSEAISVGATQPGDLMIMYGSTTFFILVLDTPVPDPRTWTTAGAFEGQYALAAGMSTTGSLTRWFRDEFAPDLPEDSAYQALFDGARKVPPGAAGLLLLPYFSGERTPINDPRAKGVIAGLTLSHTRDHLFRAVLEGVGFGIRHNLETFAEMGAPPQQILAVGGGTKNDTWTRLVSNIAGVPQLVPQETIGASYGDAFLAGLVSGAVERSDLTSWVGALRTIEPRASLQPLYDGLFADFKDLYAATRAVVHRLS